MLSSKEVLEKTGISRATLNNYISSGIVPRPEVLPPGPQDGDAPRIGYFPPEIVERIEEIQRLKREGWSLTRITEHFTGGVAPARPAPAPVTASQETVGPAFRAGPVAVQAAVHGPGEMPRLSFGEISQPAYLVNNRFELVWMNDAAASAAWPNFVPLPRHAVSQGIFQHLLQAGRGLGVSAASRAAILRLHLGLARQLGAGFADLSRGVSPGEVSTMERLYNEVEPFEFPLVVRTPVAPAGAATGTPLYLYALNFREGILFLYVPGGAASVDMSALLAEPAPQDRQPRRAQPPALTQVAVLVTELQDAAGLWAALPPEEYFELINDLWQAVEPIFKRHGGTRGVHPGEGMVCYFLPRAGSNYLWSALLAARDVREAMRRLGKDWAQRKGWSTPLCLNTGIDEGLEWHGTLRPGAEGEFTVLGDAVNHAAGASILARDGAIWATRNLVSKLRADERRRLEFGVRRVTQEGAEPVRSIYARVEDLAALGAPGNEALRAMAGLAITEIFDIAADADI